MLHKNKKFTRIIVFSTFAICLAFEQALAGGYYKWVDKQGQVHYSQTPPQQNQQVNELERKTLNDNAVKLTWRGPNAYCGDYKLPVNKNYVDYANYLTEYKNRWIDEKNALKKQIMGRDSGFAINAYGPEYRTGRDLPKYRINQLNCMISWASGMISEVKYPGAKVEKSTYRAMIELNETKSKCGPKPKIEGWTADKEAKDWVTCQSEIRNEYNQRINELRKAKNRDALKEYKR